MKIKINENKNKNKNNGNHDGNSSVLINLVVLVRFRVFSENPLCLMFSGDFHAFFRAQSKSCISHRIYIRATHLIIGGVSSRRFGTQSFQKRRYSEG